MNVPSFEDRCTHGVFTPAWCSKPRRRDMLLDTCWKHTTEETRHVLAEMVKNLTDEWQIKEPKKKKRK
jgi:hypothetical protein